ncbi:hypothetical protein D9619_005053 [Psilocybe cf. subviscida]|uniref:F-box domain-containing protein n=1 Tax=Psilocybe cf. subviscida TaxID=2480587 RepID=A0A8H5BPU9_9AGAR|nr:hypothetical protein D9619_005053 [Psilocybe cf. subviscida]
MAGHCEGLGDPRDLDNCICHILVTNRPETAPTSVDNLPIEMLNRIAEFCTWGALVAASQVNSRFRCVARRLLYQRMKFFLLIYLGPNWSGGFFATLKETSGAIIGGVPRCIVTFQDMGRILMKELPLEMNIVVPYNGNKSIRQWRKYLTSLGFSLSPRGIDGGGNELIMSLESSPFDVKVIEVVQHRIGSVFLSASNTALMIAITSSHIQVLYPELHDDNVNVNFVIASPRRWWENNLCDFTFGLRTHSTTEFWQKPCGTACPVLWATIDNVPPLSYQWMKGTVVMDKDLDLWGFTWRLPGIRGHGLYPMRITTPVQLPSITRHCEYTMAIAFKCIDLLHHHHPTMEDTSVIEGRLHIERKRHGYVANHINFIFMRWQERRGSLWLFLARENTIALCCMIGRVCGEKLYMGEDGNYMKPGGAQNRSAAKWVFTIENPGDSYKELQKDFREAMNSLMTFEDISMSADVEDRRRETGGKNALLANWSPNGGGTMTFTRTMNGRKEPGKVGNINEGSLVVVEFALRIGSRGLQGIFKTVDVLL